MRSPAEVAGLLHELADRVTFAGQSPFKARAYREAAERILSGDVDLSHPETFENVRGIGAKIAGKLREMASGEDTSTLARLRQEQPPELTDILALPGIGPAAARKLWEAGIGRVSEIERRVIAGEPLPGISRTQLQHLMRAVSVRREGIPLIDLLRATEVLADRMPGMASAGELRRLDPVVARPLWLVPDTEANRRIWAELQPWVLPGAFAIPQESVRFVPHEAFGLALLLETGPEEFIQEVDRALQARGVRRVDRELFSGTEIKECATETDVLRLGGLPDVPPQLRGIPAALRPLAPRQAFGDLHVHSNWSDGTADIETMTRAAVQMGYRYLAITDHSQGLTIANGLSPERLRAQRREIERLRPLLPEGFRLLQGSEVDIHPDGSLDLPDDVLAQLDVVIASVHGDFEQGVEETTARLVRAIAHPLVTVLGHPGARKLGRRPPIQADWERVFAAAAETGTALEMSASPRRLDLDYRSVRDSVLRPRLRFVVDTDAHSPQELSHMGLGLAQAQKAELTVDQVLNCGPLEGFLPG